MRLRLMVLAVVAAVVAGACADARPNVGPPWCDNWGLLMLEAQSVPSAQYIPCLEAVPLGWHAGAARVATAHTSFHLDSSIAGDDAVKVELMAGCDVAEYVAVPSDVAGTARFELVDQITSGFRGSRAYVYEGGCTLMTFEFGVEASAALVNEATLALSFISRDTINEAVRSATDGNEQLDPE